MSTGLTWAALDERARLGDLAGVTALLTGASEQQRLTFGEDLRAHFAAIHPEDWWPR
ncbi:hypothetical protein FB565_000141 [Actinoplanes lutulentus]|uniref:Uncharacterized protein n=1 Tax=Actinoplanes lutulentus TaxID=1287878 RepID=A0A327Z162_9ACTN|nr:hypothetical protein [Actinoplanes lutulentus]MBB2940437.1 hypothetical protein [Actinoplanes lutulentus]RAK25831.1 hypothetical protein B0I29_13040 [Actinoplanes lutulentus]